MPLNRIDICILYALQNCKWDNFHNLCKYENFCLQIKEILCAVSATAFYLITFFIFISISFRCFFTLQFLFWKFLLSLEWRFVIENPFFEWFLRGIHSKLTAINAKCGHFVLELSKNAHASTRASISMSIHSCERFSIDLRSNVSVCAWIRDGQNNNGLICISFIIICIYICVKFYRQSITQ